MRARLSFTLRIAVAAGLLGFVVHQLGGSHGLVEGLSRLSLPAIVAALAANTADRLLMAWKWARLLRVRGHPLSTLHATRAYCASMVWGMFLPATMGADAVRAVSTVRRGIPMPDVVASIAVERALGLLASLVVGLAGLFVVWALGDLPEMLAPFGWLGAALLAAGSGVLALSFSDRAYGWLHERLLGRFRENRAVRLLRGIHDTYRDFRRHRRELHRFWWLSVLEQLGPVLPIWILATDLGVRVPVIYLAGAVTLSFLVARVPVTLGGLGVMEGVLGFLLHQVGVPAPLAVTVAVAARIVEVASWLPWWLHLALSHGSLRRPESAVGEWPSKQRG